MSMTKFVMLGQFCTLVMFNIDEGDTNAMLLLFFLLLFLLMMMILMMMTMMMMMTMI